MAKLNHGQYNGYIIGISNAHPGSNNKAVKPKECLVHIQAFLVPSI